MNNLNISQLLLLQQMIEVTIHQQLNFIAHNNKIIKDLEDKIKKVQIDISTGKGGFFYNPNLKLEQLIQKQRNLIVSLDEPNQDVITARTILDLILDEIVKCNNGGGNLSRKKSLFEDRKNVLIIKGYKSYFYFGIGY